MSGFLYIPFWRTGGWEDITYRTQLYFAPLSRGPVRLGLYLYENGGKPWAGKEFKLELDQNVRTVRTNRDGMLEIDVGPGQMVRIEINAVEHEYGTGEVHLLSGEEQILLLSRGELEIFAAEASGFEMSASEITITGAQPVMLELMRR